MCQNSFRIVTTLLHFHWKQIQHLFCQNCVNKCDNKWNYFNVNQLTLKELTSKLWLLLNTNHFLYYEHHLLDFLRTYFTTLVHCHSQMSWCDKWTHSTGPSDWLVCYTLAHLVSKWWVEVFAQVSDRAVPCCMASVVSQSSKLTVALYTYTQQMDTSFMGKTILFIIIVATVSQTQLYSLFSGVLIYPNV